MLKQLQDLMCGRLMISAGALYVKVLGGCSLLCSIHVSQSIHQVSLGTMYVPGYVLEPCIYNKQESVVQGV